MSALFKLLFNCTIILPPKSLKKLKTNLILLIKPKISQHKAASINCDLRENIIPMKHIATTKYQKTEIESTKFVPLLAG